MRFMQLRYKNLSIIYLKFIGKSVEIKTVNLSVSNKFSYNCKKRRKEQLKPMNGLIKKFSNTYELCNGDINKFISLMRKGFYPYEYTDSQERYNEVSLPEKEAFDSELNLGDTSDEDYIHAQKVIDEFKLKSLGEYHDLYLKNYVFLLTEVFANFRSMYLEIQELDPAKFVSAPGLAWQAALKKMRVELNLLTDINMLLMTERVLEVEYATQSIVMQKPIINILMIIMKIKNRHILIIGT